MQNKVLDDSRLLAPSSAVDRAIERSLRGSRASVELEVKRLIEATLALIQETGEVEPRVSEIVKLAGVHNQAFYRHFRSKRELLVAALDHGVVLLAGYLRHRMERAERGEDKVREWVGGVLEQALQSDAADATRPFVLGRERLAESFPTEVARSEEQLTALLREAIELAQHEGGLPVRNAERDAEAIYLLTMGWIGRRMLDTQAPTRADAAYLTDFALSALGAARGTARGRAGTTAEAALSSEEAQ